MRNLIYFSPVATQPIGGVKVFYRHASLINELKLDDWRAQVFHMEQPAFTCDWFKHQTATKTDGVFHAVSDFAILPECHLWSFWRQLLDINVRYGIFVQGGYLIGANPSVSMEELSLAYDKASLILTISDDTAECVRLFAPESAHKIVHVRYSIPADLFHDCSEKQNLITFMPRKMPEHSRLVLIFLQRLLPSNWAIVPIDGLPEAEVAATLRKSKIFMSFSSLEGLPMPPAEAALCGNYVVGYTGQGALEYWEPGLFTEVAMGDIRTYVREVLQLVHRLDIRQRLGLANLDEQARIALESLKARFTIEQETARLRSFINRVNSLEFQSH